jgi:hypothetical protein
MAARPESTGRTVGDLVWLRLEDIEPLAVTFKVAEKISGLGPTSLWKAANQGRFLLIHPPGICRTLIDYPSFKTFLAPDQAHTPQPRGRGRPPKSAKTCLSVALACAMPAWAALCASGVKNHAPPPQATRVAICTHPDVNFTGERVAQGAARWLAEGRVRVATSPEPGTDFNDVLTGRAATKGNEARHASPIGAVTQCDTWPAPDMRLVNNDHAPTPSLDDALPAGWKAWIVVRGHRWGALSWTAHPLD